MKHLFFLGWLVLCGFATTFAREDLLRPQDETKEVTVSEDSIMAKNNQYVFALSVHIPESDVKAVTKNWGRTIKNNTKSKFLHHHYVTSLHGTVVKEVSPMPINVYFSCVQKGDAVELNAAFEIDTSFVSPTVLPDKYANAHAFLRTYGVARYRAAVEEELKTEKRKLRSAENNMKKLFNEKKKLESIAKTRTLEIPHLEKDLEENLSFVKMKTDEIATQIEVVSGVVGEVREQEGKKLEELKRARKKLQNEGKRITKKTAQYKSDIQEAEHGIERNQSEQQLQKQKVKEQRVVVEGVERKLDSIE